MENILKQLQDYIFTKHTTMITATEAQEIVNFCAVLHDKRPNCIEPETLTKREYFAAKAMQGILANPYNGSNVAYVPGGEIADVAAKYADALVNELL